MLCACHSLLAFIEEDLALSVLRNELLKGGPSSQLNGPFTRNAAHGLMEGNEYQIMEMVQSFISDYVDKAHGYVKEIEHSKVDIRYSELLLGIFCTSPNWNIDFDSVIEKTVAKLRVTMSQLCEDQFEFELFMVRLHLHHRLCHDLEKLKA